MTGSNGIVSIYSASGFVNTWYDPQKHAIVVRWSNFTTRVHQRPSFIAHLAALKKYRPKALIIDTGDTVGLPYPQDQEWFKEIMYPNALEIETPFIMTIFPKNPITKMGMKTWLDIGRNLGLNFIEVENLEEAYVYLKNN